MTSINLKIDPKAQMKEEMAIDIENGTQAFSLSPQKDLLPRVANIFFAFSPFIQIFGQTHIFYASQIAKAIFPLFNFQEHLPLFNRKIPQTIEKNPYFNGAIAEKVREIALKMGIEKEVQIYERLDNTGCAAQATGHNFCKEIGIAFHPAFLFPHINLHYTIDAKPATPEQVREHLGGFSTEKSLNFLIGHELAHIKNNDLLKLTFVPAITQIATVVFFNQFFFPQISNTIALPESFKNLTSGIAAIYLGLGAQILTSRYVEKQADILSGKTMGKDATEGGIECFKALQNSNKAIRNQEGLSWFESLKRKLFISSEGDNRLDLAHPALSDRIKTLANLSFT